MSRKVLCLTAIIVVLMAGCGPKKLTRGSAEEILNKTGARDPTGEITLSLDQLTKLGQLDKSLVGDIKARMTFGDKPCLPDSSDIRLATGQAIHCVGFFPPGLTWQRPGMVAKLTKPVAWKIIEITGISDDPHAPSDKIVEYTWKYDLVDFPKPVEEVINPSPPYQGKSLLRLYDDGWRFVDYRN